MVTEGRTVSPKHFLRKSCFGYDVLREFMWTEKLMMRSA